MWFVYMAGMLWTWVYLQSCWSLWLVSWLVVSAESLKTRMQYIYSTHEIAYIYIYIIQYLLGNNDTEVPRTKYIVLPICSRLQALF